MNLNIQRIGWARVAATFPALCGTLVLFSTSWAGPKLTFDDGKKSLEIMQAYQVWGVATLDPKNVPVPDARADLYLRTARLGLKGMAYPDLDYLVWFAYDNIGKDPITGSMGAPQAMPNTVFQALDAYFTYHLDSTWANVTFGLFRPQVGTEFITSESVLPSLDKALTHYYVRDQLDSRTSGRETGINLGGWRADTTDKYAFGYNFGIFDAAQEKVTTVAAGSLQWSPLLTGKISGTWGDPENKDYKLSTEPNSFGKRTGVTVAAFASWQGKTDEKLDTTQTNPYIGGFAKNSVMGSSLLLNWLGLELDAEWDLLYREFSDGFPALYAATKKNTTYVKSTAVEDQVWHVRGGYSFLILKTQFVEPTLMYSRFDGEKSDPTNSGGSDKVLDAGLNWYVQKNNLKITLHYVKQDGDAKSLFTQGANKKGELKQRNDYLAVGFVVGILGKIT